MFGYIDFIDKHCHNEILARSLYLYYIKGERKNDTINCILKYNNFFQLDFKREVEEYKDIFQIYLKARFELDFLNIPHASEASGRPGCYQKVDWWDYKGPGNILLKYQDILTKYQTSYFYYIAQDFLKGSILDLGGCTGSLSDSLKKKDSSLNFTSLDLKSTIDKIKKYRDIKYIGDNILTHNYDNYDVCICKDVLKSFKQEDILKVLSKLKNNVNTIIIYESMGKMLDKADSPCLRSSWVLEILLSHNKPEFYFEIAKKIGMDVALHKTCDKNGYDTIILTK